MKEAIMIYLLIGTYSPENADGIFVYDLNTESGKTEYVSSVSGLANPSYLAVSEDEQFVYAASESGEDGSAAGAFSFDKETGRLTSINKEATKGAGPCYVLTDSEKGFVMTANYRGGNISVFPITEDGSLKAASQVFDFFPESHMHMGIISPDKRYLFATDLGKDRIYKFIINDTSGNDGRFLRKGSPEFFSVHKGAGPRHMVFHPNGKYFYCINELDGTVSCFNYNDGVLSEFQNIASDTVEHERTKGSADIHISPNGKFLYSSNRLKNDGIAIFRINEMNGKLTSVGYQSTGVHPRSFIITPNGKFLLVANQHSNLIQVFSIDPTTGLLTDTKQDITIIEKPVCLKFVQKE
ncbi:lactonase family protein [Massilibacteroides sp.]|uniref:lactonase family protein n=1 Tax=Massilibacteroides sp. TaxID=2034766 RepID=UPI002632F568|nr:lactonase family protein [Massilibacteroides sp.]MDD4515494.1 lactonase family protein [Massilibacteroides sp.]